jgi:hypothetical protein
MYCITDKLSATHIGHETKNKHFPFLKLPMEIRRKICKIHLKAYDDALEFYAMDWNQSYPLYHTPPNPTLIEQGLWDHPIVGVNLILTCRQIYHEARDVKRTVRLWTYHDSALRFLKENFFSRNYGESGFGYEGGLLLYGFSRGCNLTFTDFYFRHSITKLCLNLSLGYLGSSYTSLSFPKIYASDKKHDVKKYNKRKCGSAALHTETQFPYLKEVQILVYSAKECPIAHNTGTKEFKEFNIHLHNLAISIPKDVKVWFSDRCHGTKLEKELRMVSREQLEDIVDAVGLEESEESEEEDEEEEEEVRSRRDSHQGHGSS